VLGSVLAEASQFSSVWSLHATEDEHKCAANAHNWAQLAHNWIALGRAPGDRFSKSLGLPTTREPAVHAGLSPPCTRCCQLPLPKEGREVRGAEERCLEGALRGAPVLRAVMLSV
jgi:hypothetical protein